MEINHVLFLIVSSVILQSDAQYYRQYQALNDKINLIKKTLEREIDDLKYEVLDLKAELHIERGRTAILESIVNGSTLDADGQTPDFRADDGVKEHVQNLINDGKHSIKELNSQVTMAVERTTNNSMNVEQHGLMLRDIKQHMQETSNNLTLTASGLQHIIATNVQLDSVLKGSIDDIKISVEEFVKLMQRSFQAEKTLRLQFQEKLSEELASMVGDIFETNTTATCIKAVKEIRFLTRWMNTSNADLVDIRKELNEMNNHLRILNKTLTASSIKQLEGEGHQFTPSPKVGQHTDTTKSNDADTPTVEPQTSLTLTPGGPRIYQIYGEELSRKISIGSRVVRGKDWTWGIQDGNGPGTVDQWNRNSQQVMVTWDRGKTKRANYRIGASGKYDLYLLAEEGEGHWFTPSPKVGQHTDTTKSNDADSPTVEPQTSVTLTPGGPRIYPIYGEELSRKISIGSRVVRGKDWSWGIQDGNGPGRVDQWYNNDRSSQQVMVTWDRGKTKRANYRIGAYGKYDLYLLAEEVADAS